MSKTALLKVLALKELRESAAILGVTAIVSAWVLGNFMNWDQIPLRFQTGAAKAIPFAETTFAGVLACVGGVLAVALGLKQSAGESNDNRFHFLLHRPASRRTIVLVKLLAGLACLLFFTVGPTTWYASWAMTPGNHASPFSWGMTADAWIVCWALPTVYLATFLSGLRPARWWGTRLLPIAGGVVLCTVFAGPTWSELHWLLGLSGLLMLNAALVQIILATAKQRDY